MVTWMPAHTHLIGTNTKLKSDGAELTISEWRANQLADQYHIQASTLQDGTTCTDRTSASGGVWADRNGNNCAFYFRAVGAGCSRYVAGTYCCQCGGGGCVEAVRVVTAGSNQAVGQRSSRAVQLDRRGARQWRRCGDG